MKALPISKYKWSREDDEEREFFLKMIQRPKTTNFALLTHNRAVIEAYEKMIFGRNSKMNMHA